ncbi:hypothetical protein QTA56_06380 [Acinetobacter sp. VNH17]|uniref:Uncharacterized protein n=1 Tax=Acinetobacter thutiue TaxID=2998078 RepID=A0ABT7WMI1_9GAMM|nr:hypothetical protein [Acinetobacter thutiue]MCY6411766.1 hypothetical protein [Acinetobacter thutiue]MDN0013868.1 hypothetical protein [Acinetobacter thutiue]
MKKYGILSTLTLSILAVQSFAASNLHSLDDDQMRQATGQALLYMGTTLGTDIDPDYKNKYGGGTSDFNFYKMGLQADLEINANIKKLQLGCGGVNGAGGCDIDIENLALSGVPTQVKSDGTPVWNYTGATDSSGALINERASSDAILRNPFIEFAIKNPNDLATREMAGVRLSAEGIKGYMTAGTYNDTATSTLNQGGINTFSGYIIVDQTAASAKTQAAKFGLTEDQKIYVPVYAALDWSLIASLQARRAAYTDVSAMGSSKPSDKGVSASTLTSDTWGINIASLAVNFQFPQTVVTGNRMSQLNLKVDNVPINPIVVSAKDGPIYVAMDQSIVTGGLASIIGLNEVKNATFFMGFADTYSWTVVDPTATRADGTKPYDDLTTAQKADNLTLARDLYNNNETIKAAANSLANGGTPTDIMKQTAANNYMGCMKGGAMATGSCTTIDNLYANVAVQQNFTRMHNLPIAKAVKDASGKITGYDFNKGFYLSLQNQKLRWPGSNSDDIAQPGWWMSFSEPLNFGKLEVQKEIPMSDVLPQVATFITNFFSIQDQDASGNPLYAVSTGSGITKTASDGSGDSISMDYKSTTTNPNAANVVGAVPKNQVLLGNSGAQKAAQGLPLYVPLGSIDIKGVPAVMQLSDLPLSNYQAVVPNCYGGLKFC